MARTSGNATGVYVADKTAFVRVNGKQILISKGYTTVRAGHPLYEQNKHLFVPLTVHYDVPQDQPKRGRVKEEPVTPTVKDVTATTEIRASVNPAPGAVDF